MSALTLNNILSVSPEEILEDMENSYIYEIPNGIHTEQEVHRAGELLGELMNSYAYTMSLLTRVAMYYKTAKIALPSKPNSKASTDEIESYYKAKNAIDTLATKKYILENYTDLIKAQYNGLSRMITVKIKEDEEARMSDSRTQVPF